MTTYEFSPVFRKDVFVVCPPGVSPQFPNGTHWQIRPSLCLSDDSAKQLAELLADLKPIVVAVQPTGVMWRFYDSTTVPGFLFPDGTVVNAGDIAMWWIRCDPATAFRTAVHEIQVAMHETAQAGAQ